MTRRQPGSLREQQLGERGTLIGAQHLALLEQLCDHRALLRLLQREDRGPFALDRRGVGLRRQDLAHHPLAMAFDPAGRSIQFFDEAGFQRFPSLALRGVEPELLGNLLVPHAEE